MEKLYDIWFDIKNAVKNAERWIAFRTYDKYHVVKTDLKPGYYDIDTRILHSNFTLLVDFVEIEKASLQYFFASYEEAKNNSRVSFNKLTKEQKKELGLQYLNWEIENDEEFFPKQQKVSAKEIKNLYLWWTEVRPSRIDPYDKYEEELDELSGSLNNMPEKNKKKLINLYKKIAKLEDQYEKEDDAMLIRLMNVRRNLWT